jgi:hypothetical protein
MAEKRNACRIFVRKQKGMRHRWVDNIKMDLTEIGWDGMDWVDVAQDRDQCKALADMIMNLRVP